MNPYEYLYTDKVEEVECVICHDDMPIDEAHEPLESIFICDPDIEPRCMWEWNNENFVRSEFYD